MSFKRHALTAVIVLMVVQSRPPALAQTTDVTAVDWIDGFTVAWDETAWEQQFRRSPAGYMRRDDDAGWETRMRALRGLVKSGSDALPALNSLLETGDDPQRILAAQALGYIAAADSRGPLLVAAGSDGNPAVRLYAVDSLGMLGPGAADIDWQELLENESVGDVKKHIQYAIERDAAAVDPAIVETLSEWDPATISSVAVGEPAPDFELESAQGGTIRLSDFRGKKAVVLVFVYGDT